MFLFSLLFHHTFFSIFSYLYFCLKIIIFTFYFFILLQFLFHILSFMIFKNVDNFFKCFSFHFSHYFLFILFFFTFHRHVFFKYFLRKFQVFDFFFSRLCLISLSISFKIIGEVIFWKYLDLMEFDYPSSRQHLTMDFIGKKSNLLFIFQNFKNITYLIVK